MGPTRNSKLDKNKKTANSRSRNSRTSKSSKNHSQGRPPPICSPLARAFAGIQLPPGRTIYNPGPPPRHRQSLSYKVQSQRGPPGFYSNISPIIERWLLEPDSESDSESVYQPSSPATPCKTFPFPDYRPGMRTILTHKDPAPSKYPVRLPESNPSNGQDWAQPCAPSVGRRQQPLAIVPITALTGQPAPFSRAYIPFNFAQPGASAATFEYAITGTLSTESADATQVPQVVNPGLGDGPHHFFSRLTFTNAGSPPETLFQAGVPVYEGHPPAGPVERGDGQHFGGEEQSNLDDFIEIPGNDSAGVAPGQ